MAEATPTPPRRYAIDTQLDIEQILSEAQHRWLRPAEICEILRNYTKFRIAPEPANRPSSGSLFLFNRKVLRYFRKDGHNWRKKKDGKTVKEAHERLKAGSIDVLHCYYAHGEDNENFQRRSYWLLEEELSHIVLVHYREVKGNRTNFNRIKAVEGAIPDPQETDENISSSDVIDSGSSKFHQFNYPMASQTTDSTSLNSTHASEYEDAESVYSHQSTSNYHSFPELHAPVIQKMTGPYYSAPFSNEYQGKFMDCPEINLFSQEKGKNSSVGLTFESQKQLDPPSWGNVLHGYGGGLYPAPFQPILSSSRPECTTVLRGQGNSMLGEDFVDVYGNTQEFKAHQDGQERWQIAENQSSQEYSWSMNQNSHIGLAYNVAADLQEDNNAGAFSTWESGQNKHVMQENLQRQLLNVEDESLILPDVESHLTSDGRSSSLKPPLLEGLMKEGLKKLDSFDRWMSKELGDVKESQTQSTSQAYWETVESEGVVDNSSITPQVHLDTYMLSPSLSQDQLFSIIDFSPSWAYTDTQIKILITGKFLKSQQDLQRCKWACMFGELEVPAEVVADGVLCCNTPKHEAGMVPFYVTCSNRLACSEVREFEFKVQDVRDMDATDIIGDSSSEALHMRFGKLLTLGSSSPQQSVPSVMVENPNLINKINSLIHDDEEEWDQIVKLSDDESSANTVREKLLQKLLKEKLHAWLLNKIAEGGKGPCVLDEGGQGVLHFAAALGYDWAIPPTVEAGVSINFRDVNGWTALHWAASCGRERTVAFLVSRGAAAGALADPTPKYPSGRTPADLASINGHKGIAGYLAEAAISSHLFSLELKETKDGDSGISLQTVSERLPTPATYGDNPQGLSLKDSLAAVYNATQAASRIHQVFRVQSFQKKQLKEYSDNIFGLSDEQDFSFLAGKTNRGGQNDEPVHAAAIKIQNKFRSWKGRREFVLMRQRVIKIQALVRGHQVRKNYKKIVWSVGILDKVILRWRRKGSGLRGFKREALPEGSSMEEKPPKEDDYDFLKEGRKQTEERLQKALARVKSMVQYPEARDQYRRLLNVVDDMHKSEAVYNSALESSSDAADFDEDLLDLEAMLADDDTLMPALS